MQRLVRALKEFATPEQVIAYRRRRPYVHYGPVTVRPAEQDMLGAWTLGDSVALYLMPTGLVLLDGATVRQADRAEYDPGGERNPTCRPANDGGVGSLYGGRPTVAFALKPYEAFASALADAARHTLEDPVEWLGRKKKKGDDLDIDEELLLIAYNGCTRLAAQEMKTFFPVTRCHIKRVLLLSQLVAPPQSCPPTDVRGT